MKAVIQTAYGGPEVMRIAELPKPAPGLEQVLIRNRASCVSAADRAFRSGSPAIVRLFAGLLRPRQQLVGDVIAGEIVEVGANVTEYVPGDRVFGVSYDGGSASGSLAEYVVLNQSAAIVKMPDGMDFDTAAAIVDGGATAISFLQDHCTLYQGTKILINGGSSSIGSMGIQIAKAKGAEVTAVCSGRNVDRVSQLGADHVVNYETQPVAGLEGQFDVIFDAVGTLSFMRTRHILNMDGRFLTTVPSWGIFWHMMVGNRVSARTAKLAMTGLRPAADKKRDFATLAGMWRAGQISPLIDGVYPADQIVEAHQRVDTQRKVGALVVQLFPSTAHGG